MNEARAVKIPLSRVLAQRTLSISSLADMGCQTSGCDEHPTHVALVEVTLDSGESFSSVQHLCPVCALARTGRELPQA